MDHHPIPGSNGRESGIQTTFCDIGTIKSWISKVVVAKLGGKPAKTLNNAETMYVTF
jgi:hypothetical protein